MELDNILQLVFGLLALLVAVLSSYFAWKCTTGRLLCCQEGTIQQYDVYTTKWTERWSWSNSSSQKILEKYPMLFNALQCHYPYTRSRNPS